MTEQQTLMAEIKDRLDSTTALCEDMACLAADEHDAALMEAIPGDLAWLVGEVERVEATRDAALQRAEQAERDRNILSLAVPLEEELSGRIDEMCKHLAMQNGYTLNGIAQLLVDAQRRMAADWVEIGRERRQRQQAEAACSSQAGPAGRDDD